MEINIDSILIALGSGLIGSLVTVFLSWRFEVKKTKQIQIFQDKLAIYRLIIDYFADFITDIEAALRNGQKIPREKYEAFDKMRVKTYGYLCLYGSQESINHHEELVAYIFDVVHGEREGEWSDMREIAMKMLNAFRKDCNDNIKEVSYQGDR